MNVDTPNNARLVIHSEGASGADGLFESTLRRLRSLHSIATRLYARSPLAVQIDDLQGRSVLTIAAAGPLLDVPLPAGTYHVIKQLSPRFQKMTPHLQNVPDHTFIEMHVGNYPRDTHGCILLGETRAPDFIGNSQVAFDRFMAMTPDEFDITISDPPEAT